MQPTGTGSKVTSILLFAMCLTLYGGSDRAHQSTDTITSTVDLVVAPTTVEAGSGEFVRDLQIRDFEIYDNNVLQKITDDLRDSPFSFVVVIQRSADMEGVLPAIRKLGRVLTDLIVGPDGEIAVVGFDHQPQLMQDFTSDGDKVCHAMSNLKAGSYNHAVIDAVTESVRMLKNRPRERRRIVLVIAEKWDKGSEGTVKEALTEAEFANVAIYSLVVSTTYAKSTSQPDPQPPPPLPFIAYHVPAGAALTPTTVLSQTYYLGNWIPLFVSIFQASDVFTASPVDVFTHFAGGKEYPFDSKRTLDAGIQKLIEELHSQYLLAYAPNNLTETGFHEIRVVVKRPSLRVSTRAGYWIAGKPEP